MSDVTKKHHQKIQGVVVSDKMQKTRVVEVRRNVPHKLYRKSIFRRSRFFVHDEKNEAKLGDLVVAVLTRPLSRNKHFILKEIVTKGH